jgi:prepilin-type N-terminal cleavage/methylation domain-containing protein
MTGELEMKQPSGRNRGFTLIELLAVVAIIGVLVAILIPATSAVRRQARTTASKATLSAIETGLEGFRADSRLGGAYPPSRSDISTGTHRGKVANPYHPSGNQTANYITDMTGAGLLVWALGGADESGTAGFRTFASSSTFWGEDTHAVFPDGAYSRYPNNHSNAELRGQIANARSGPYVDLSKVRVSQIREVPANSRIYRFEIPAEVSARGGADSLRDYPMALDAFGYPILYYRADPAGRAIVDERNDGDPYRLTSNERRGIYHWADNGPLVDGDDRLRLRGGVDGHVLQAGYVAAGVSTSDVLSEQQYRGKFVRYITNPNIMARPEPQRPDSYLLISAGADGVYGTADDVTNFAHNGSK